MKHLSIQQAYLDGWERCRLTMMVKLQEMLVADRIKEVVENSVDQVEFAGHNPTCDELNEYQDGGYRQSNATVERR